MTDRKQVLETSLHVAETAAGVAPGIAEAEGILNLILLAEPLVLTGITMLLHKIHHSSNKVIAVKAASIAVDPYVDQSQLYNG